MSNGGSFESIDLSKTESDMKASVLVVDDDPEVRDILRLLFELEDFEVWEAATGPESITSVLGIAPEFIVLDYLMPGMNGDRVAPLLRSLVPDARIVAFSASLEAKPPWADAFLNKSRISEISHLLSTLWPVAQNL